MTIEGFNYVTQRRMDRTREDWREMLDNVIDHGGRRRVEKGETFAHNERGQIVFEVYANIPARGTLADVSDLL